MPPEPTSPGSSTSAHPADRWLAVLLLAATALAFWPVVTWLASQTFAHEQLKQSFFITVLAGLWIAWEKRAALRLHLQLDRTGLVAALTAYACIAGALLLKTPLLVLVGLVAAAAAGVQILFGNRALRRAAPLLAAFGLLIVFVLLFPVLDWPLRKMAGIESAKLLQHFGLASHLQIVADPDAQLRLVTNHGVFVVATECNGFGLITSSLLLGTICLLYRRAGWWRYPVLLVLCLAVAFAINLARIATIIGLAPRFPGHYHAMHETAGIVALYLGLGIVWLLTGWRRR